MLVAEGQLFPLTDTFETAGLVGPASAIVLWGDGTQSTASLTSNSQTGNIRIRFDYSLDTSGFFRDPARRALLDLAARMVTTKLGDNLTAIQPTGTNRWSARFFHPATGATVSFPNLAIAANELVVYVGARDLPGNQLGIGGPGGFEASGTAQWLNLVKARGQSGALLTPATDTGPWGGSLTFDSATKWYFGAGPQGLQRDQQDFVTVASHELLHLLGIGTIPSWNRLVSNQTFTGPKSRAAHDAGGNVPLTSDLTHWTEATLDSGRKTLMGPTISLGTRDTLTGLDLAGLDDIGWDILDIRGNLTAQHVYPDNGVYPISITYTGASIGQFADTATAIISNAAPTLTTVSNQTVLRDQLLNIVDIGTISDMGFRNPLAQPPTGETFNYVISWGDGSATDNGTATIDRLGAINLPTLASFNGTHSYKTTGTYTVTVRVSDDDNASAQKSFQVQVIAPPQLSLEINRSTLPENAGASAATLIIRRSGSPSSSPTIINLSSSDATEITVPASVTIPAGQSSVTTMVNAVDDALLDGTQSVTIVASGVALATGSLALMVTDVETISAAFSADTVREDIAAGLFFLTVTRTNTDVDRPLTVAITGNIPSEISVPSTATIPAGSRQVRIPIQPIDDDLPEPAETIAYQVSAPGYVAAAVKLTLIDDEPPLFQNTGDRFDADGNGTVQPLDALRIINFLSRRTRGAALDPTTETPNGFFVDVSGDYQATALDALLTINELSRRARAGTVSGESMNGSSSASS